MSRPIDLSGLPNRRELLAEASRLGCLVEPIKGTGEIRVTTPGGLKLVLNNRKKGGTVALRDALRKGQKGEWP